MGSDINMEDMDDCPELYGDLEDSVKAGIRDRCSGNAEDVEKDRKLVEQLQVDRMPALVGCERKQLHSAGFGIKVRDSISRRPELLMPCTSETASSYYKKMAITQNGLDFYLPSDWTTLNIDIETFGRKPWRHKRVDKANSFNRSYCDSVPKGSGIQVETGFGDRIPSFYRKSSRRYDSDVVIQIPLVDNVEDNVKEISPSDDKDQETPKGQGLIADSALICENDVHECLLSVDHEGQRSGEFTKSMEYNHQKLKTTISVAVMPDAGEGNDNIPGRQEEAMAKAEFSSGNEVSNSSKSVYLETHSEASGDGFPLVKAPYPSEGVSFNLYCGLLEPNMLECNLSNEFASNTCKTMTEYGKDVAHDGIIPLGADKYGNETRTQFDAQLYVLANDDQNHNLACKMHQNPDVTSFSIGKDNCLRIKKNMENDHQIWTEVEHDRMMSVCKRRDRFEPELNKSMYNQNSCFNFDSSSQFVENDVSNWDTFEDRFPDPPTYREDILHERSSYSSDTFSLRKRSSNSGGSSEKYWGHSRLRSIVEIPSKNKGDDSIVHHGHGFHQSSYRKGHYSSCAKYRDDFNVGERSSTEKIVHYIKRSSNHLTVLKYSAENDVNIGHSKQLPHNLSSPRWNSKYGIDRVDKNSLRGRKLFDDHRLSKARKNMLAEAVEKTNSRRHRTEVQCIVGKERPAQMALCHKKKVNISLNSWEGKISKESNGLGDGSFWRSQVNVNPADKGTMDLIHVKQEVGSHSTSEVKGNSRLTRSKVRRTKKRKLKHSSCLTRKLPEMYPSSKGNENDEIEEGELIEEPGYKELASRKHTPISDNKVAHLDVAAPQSNHVTEEKIGSKDVQHINKLIVGLESEHVLETVAKMERRKERFKKPIVSRQESVKTLNPPVDTTLMDEVMQQRPARKRPWVTVR